MSQRVPKWSAKILFHTPAMPCLVTASTLNDKSGSNRSNYSVVNHHDTSHIGDIVGAVNLTQEETRCDAGSKVYVRLYMISLACMFNHDAVTRSINQLSWRSWQCQLISEVVNCILQYVHLSCSIIQGGIMDAATGIRVVGQYLQL